MENLGKTNKYTVNSVFSFSYCFHSCSVLETLKIMENRLNPEKANNETVKQTKKNMSL